MASRLTDEQKQRRDEIIRDCIDRDLPNRLIQDAVREEVHCSVSPAQITEVRRSMGKGRVYNKKTGKKARKVVKVPEPDWTKTVEFGANGCIRAPTELCDALGGALEAMKKNDVTEFTLRQNGDIDFSVLGRGQLHKSQTV